MMVFELETIQRAKAPDAAGLPAGGTVDRFSWGEVD